MLLKNQSRNNGNIFNQFQTFRSQLEKSGQNPQELLNSLVSSGKVSKQQLDNAVKTAKMFSYLLGGK